MSQIDLEYICKLLFDLYKLPISFMNNLQDVEYEFYKIEQFRPFPDKLEFPINELISNNLPYMITTPFLENYLLIPVKERGFIKIGPTLLHNQSSHTIKGLKQDYHLTIENHIMESYYQALPIVNQATLLVISKTLYYMLYQEKLSDVQLLEYFKKNQTKSLEMNNTDLIVSENKQNHQFHHPYLLEKELFKCITDGRKEDFIQKKSQLDGIFGVLSKKSHIRSQKNLVISSITLATRAAMEGGLDQETAYTLSDVYIQTLEDLQTLQQIDSLQTEAFLEFADRVLKAKQKKYSKTINDCIQYIYKHLYEDITVSKIASYVQKSPNYISTVFKAEVGISLALYIQQQRIEETKKLLTFSDDSITEIYTKLNFTDQSYFTKIFKSFTGYTPKQYREKFSFD